MLSIPMAPMWAGVTTAGGALLASTLPKDARWRDALYAASLGAGGLVGLQVFAEWMAKRNASANKSAAQPQSHEGAKPAAAHRQADGDSPSYVTRSELNEAIGQLADKSAQQQKQANCDLVTALREEIRRVVIDMHETPGAAPPRPATKSPMGSDSYLRPLATRSTSTNRDEPRNGSDDYMSSAYGGRNAFADEERNAGFDEERNAGFDEERNAGFDEERNANFEEERNANFDEERNAFAEEERNANFDEERNADE
jgi:hypothetical protein